MKVTYSGSSSSHPCSKAKLLVKVDLYNVPGRKVHEAKPEAGDDPNTDIEDKDARFRRHVNVDGGCEEPEGGDGDAEDGHEAVTQPRGQGGHQGAAAKCQEDEEGAGESGLCPANIEPLAYPGQKEAK